MAGGGKQPNSKYNADSLISLYMCAVIAACHTEIYTFPLDLIKTRLQIQGALTDKIGAGPKRGMMKTAIGVVKEEGILGLWSGISAIFARHSVYSGIRMIVYDESRKYFQKQNPDGKLSVWQIALCGVACGFIAQFAASPADVVKVQLQMEGKRKLMGLPPRVTGFWDAFIKVYKVGGIKGLWIGWIPNVQRSILVNLGDFSTYDIAKRAIKQYTSLPDKILLHCLSSFCAGLTAAVLSTPADVIKSRVMNQPVDKNGKGLLYKGTWDCFLKTVRTEGFLAIYKGFLPAWIRLGPWNTIYWISYENLRRLMGGEPF